MYFYPFYPLSPSIIESVTERKGSHPMTKPIDFEISAIHLIYSEIFLIQSEQMNRCYGVGLSCPQNETSHFSQHVKGED